MNFSGIAVVYEYDKNTYAERGRGFTRITNLDEADMG